MAFALAIVIVVSAKHVHLHLKPGHVVCMKGLARGDGVPKCPRGLPVTKPKLLAKAVVLLALAVAA